MVKGASATKSGVMNLPMILSVTVFSVVTGGLVSVLGYYGPFMILSTVCMSVGAGLMANFETSTGSAKWIGYQILYGVGLGFGFQQALTAVQTCSAPADVPIATALVTFAQNFGGALFLIVAQSVFKSSLKKKLQSMVPHLDPDTVVNIGVTNLRKELSSRDLLPVLGAYNDAVTLAFYVSAATSAATIFGAIAVRWKSVRTQKQ